MGEVHPVAARDREVDDVKTRSEHPMQPSRLRFALIYVVAWIPFAITYGVMVGLQSRGPTPAWDGFMSAIWSTTIAATLGIGVWWVVGKLTDSPEPRRLRVALTHMTLAALYSAIWVGTIVLSIWWFAPPQVLRDFIGRALGWQLCNGVAV